MKKNQKLTMAAAALTVGLFALLLAVCGSSPDAGSPTAAPSNPAALNALLRRARSEVQRWDEGNVTVYLLDPAIGLDALMQAVTDAGFVQVHSGNYTRDWELQNGVLRWCVPSFTGDWNGQIQSSAAGETTVHYYGFRHPVENLARALGRNALVNGNTVTLTRNVRLTGRVQFENAALVVPPGLTLDLTAEGARLALGGNAVLTVNGTVNARPDGIGIESAAAAPATINGNGAINLKSKGTLISIWSGDGIVRKLILDGVTLVGLADNSDTLVVIANRSELVMKSGAVSGNTGNAGVGVHSGSTFTMEGGEISGNTGGGGAGGVSLGGGSAFIMKGGEISGNTAKTNGGGVEVCVGSTFTMEGGTISGNTTHFNGGGVAVFDGSFFIMKGGTISGNTASINGGGGVAVFFGSTFTMDGGEISGNSASNNPGGGGVRVNVDGSTFIMNGGTVYGSEAVHGANRNTVRGGSGAALLLDSGTARYGDGTNILPHTDGLSNRTDNTIAGRR